jgi:glycosyltransferase involved in cell wall biosynthesis
MKPLSLGVGLITYNGLKYLPQQLESIVSQSRSVDHIVVSDDRSTDGTWEFLEAWARESPIRVTLIRNEQQLGLGRNFEQAVAAVEADIVFSSDQDDVWFTDKVALLAAVFERDPDVLLAHTDAMLVDAQGKDMGTTLLGELELSDAERAAISKGNAFEVYCRRNVVTGATAAFRKSLLKLARPLPASLFHDAWLALIAAALGKVQLLDVPMIAYRQHGGNLVGVKKLGAIAQLRRFWWQMRGKRPLKATLRNIVAQRVALLERLTAHPEVAPSCMERATQALEFAKRREALSGNAVTRTRSVLRDASAGYYGRFSYEPWSDALHDVLSK